MNPNDEDTLDSFYAELGDVKPLTNSNERVYHHSPADSIAKKQKRAAAQQPLTRHFNPLSLEGVKPVKPDDYLSFQQAGIQDGVFKNLRLGKYALEQRLNLKGLTLEQSRDAFYQTILRSHEKGVRALLVQHGRGEQSKPFPALKKSYVQHWLMELEEVIAFHSAQPMHGGLGATYVLLKKHPQQKIINREKNRKG